MTELVHCIQSTYIDPTFITKLQINHFTFDALLVIFLDIYCRTVGLLVYLSQFMSLLQCTLQEKHGHYESRQNGCRSNGSPHAVAGLRTGLLAGLLAGLDTGLKARLNADVRVVLSLQFTHK